MAEKFWASPSLEPKRQHRWLLHLPTTNIQPYVVKKVNKPSFTVNETEHQFFGHSFWYPGQVKWNEISLTLVDPVEKDSSGLVQNLLINSGYVNPGDGRTGDLLMTVSKAESVTALGNTIFLEQYGPANQKIEEWQIWNPWIKEAKFGDLDYTSDDMVELELTLRYDWAVMTLTGAT